MLALFALDLYTSSSIWTPPSPSILLVSRLHSTSGTPLFVVVLLFSTILYYCAFHTPFWFTVREIDCVTLPSCMIDNIWSLIRVAFSVYLHPVFSCPQHSVKMRCKTLNHERDVGYYSIILKLIVNNNPSITFTLKGSQFHVYIQMVSKITCSLCWQWFLIRSLVPGPVATRNRTIAMGFTTRKPRQLQLGRFYQQKRGILTSEHWFRIQYLSSDCIVTWSRHTLYCISRSITSRF